MKYKLINPPNPKYTYQQQILFNRGIELKDQFHYLHTTDDDINDYKLLGEENLKLAWTALKEQIQSQNPGTTVFVLDCDFDGFSSSALLLNWLYQYNTDWTLNHTNYIFHEGKQHGLSDVIYEILEYPDVKLVICADSTTNDTEQCKLFAEKGIPVIVLDHHIKEKENPYAIIVNNQCSDYPNKELSGVGIVYQFLRYIEDIEDLSKWAKDFLDLIAIGLVADMESLTSIETKHLINKGFKDENVHNPFIYEMWQKNIFKIGEKITPIGAAFYIVPFVNAICRSGTIEEKKLIFNSLLSYKGNEEVPSTKRGHFVGEMETIAKQAVRVATNVKSRQSKIETAAMEVLEKKIEEENLLNHKIILFTLEGGEVAQTVAGLAANKIMAKYQRPVCVLTQGNDKEDGIIYSGSARGCDKADVTNFKSICEATELPRYVVG